MDTQENCKVALDKVNRQERQKKPLGNVLCQHFLGALGVLGGKKCDFAVLLG